MPSSTQWLTSHRCVACRQSKIKCSGNEPCANCERRAIRCRFTEGSSKVVVTERFVCILLWTGTQRSNGWDRYLQQLRRQAREQQQSFCGTKRSADMAFGPAVEKDQVYPGDANPPSVGFNDRVNSEALAPPGELLAIDHGRSVWTSPFTPPSRTIKNTYKSRRSWSTYPVDL